MRLYALLALTAFALPLAAEVVTFDSSPIGYQRATLVVGSYTFNSVSPVNAGNVGFAVTTGAGSANNGTPFYQYAGGALQISRTDGGTFTLNSIDFAIGSFGSGTYSVTVTAAGGATNNISVSGNFSTFNFSNLVSTTSVLINTTSSNGYLALDNVNITPTPEPASLALMGGALLVLGSVSRRKKRTA